MEHAQLLREAIDGSDAALNVLIRTYHDRVYRFGRGICRDHFDADDAVQEAFVKLASRPDVQRDVTVLSWLMSVVRNACLRTLKSFRRSRPRLSEEAALELELATEISPELLERWQLVDAVHCAIAALPGIYGQVLLLRESRVLPPRRAARASRTPARSIATAP